MNSYQAKEDDQSEDHEITEVRESEGYYEIGTDGLFLCVEKSKFTAPPRPGQMARYYGRGFGYPVRGLDVDGVEIYYETEEAYRVRQVIEAEERNSARRAEADANRSERDARIAALPECFQKRIARFRRNNPDFYWEHEDYEMAACVDAVKIADAHRGADVPADAINAFRALSWEDQKRVVPGLTDGHSGNTFGMACRLAHHYLTDERLVFADHAAIAPLTGCECGCPPVTDAEMRAAGYEPFPAD
jgi:hypothetical protein